MIKPPIGWLYFFILHPMRNLLTLFFLFWGFVGWSQSVQLLPQRWVPVFTADATAHRTQGRKDLASLAYHLSLGGNMPIVQWKNIQAGVAASFYSALRRYTNRGETVNADYYIDFWADYKINSEWIVHGGIGHTSHHLTDDAIRSGLIPNNYVKDYGKLMVVYQRNNKLLLYAGGYYISNFKIGVQNIAYDYSGKIMLQNGTQWNFYQWKEQNSLFIAADVKWRQEFNFGTTQTFQTGVQLGKNCSRNIKVAYQFTSGYDERGQFYDQKTDLHTIGVYLDY
jgi:hypothetical protein